MRILLLLTLIGLAVGLGVEHDCDGRVNGVYATSPCSNEFNHCYNGQVTIKTCPRGLVFNPDSNQCDFDSNVSGCAARAEVTCNNRKDGTYTIGCSSSFFFCSNGIIHMSTCQNGLFYDVDRKTCDHKFRVRACGGHPEVEREPVTRPPLLVPTYAPLALKSFAKIRGHITDFSQSCKGKPDGTYPLDSCSHQYVRCTDEISQLGKCAVGEVFVDSGKCTPVAKVPECSKALSGESTIDCSSRQDGYYSSSCSSTFVSCSNGVARQMKCPSPLVFNEVKGYCDAPEDCSSDTGLAPPADSPKSKRDYQPNADATKSVSPSFCAMRKDGLYAEECSIDFISCDQGVATPMKCPSGLLFNNKKGHCDYPEDCRSGSTALDQKLPPAASDQHLSSVATTIDCKGKKDGYYSNGCVPDYVSCISGVASLMTCPASLVFNEAKGYCDYPENCSGGSASVPPSPVLAAVPALSPQTATSVDCKGKMDGYYSKGCVPDYVSCVDGVASPMTCPASLVFNEKQGYCDYPESCTAGPAPAHSPPVPTMPAQSPSAPAMPAQSPSAAAMPAQSPSAPTYAPPASTSSVSCKGKKDGYYSNGCVSDFVHCTDGAAIPMTCPTSLVFNEKKGYCDYPESCSTRPGPAAPLPAPAVPAHSLPAPSLLASPTQSLPVDCKGKKDGYYSKGCVPDFVSCNDGVASPMTCPASLVFNEKKGFCDYPESCSEGPAPAVPLPAPTSPVHSPPAPMQASLVQSLSVDCEGKKDGYYSNGCVADFVSCNDGVASPMTCPSSLVFNEKKGYCDYPENCSSGPAPAPPLPVPPMTAQSPAQVYAPPAPTSSISCKGRKDGYYSNGCVPDFVSCIDGVASPMTCPASLVFDEKKGYCDYPESCNTGPAPALPSPVPATPVQSPSTPAYAPSAPLPPFNCKGKKDGYYSNGCVADFVFCIDGVASPMKCPASLVFNEKKGYCDYPESCSTESAPTAPLPAPAAPVPAPAAPAYAPPALLQASPVQSLAVDCKGKKDGYYSNGCVREFVSCLDGVASAMTCPASLVFDEKKGYCDYPESCSTGPAAAPPQPVPIVPVQPLALAHTAPTSLSTLSCKGKKDGYYSNGCVADFVYCVDGVASPMKCPTSLVFNEKKGYCDYPENCSSGPTPAIPSAASVHSPPMQASLQSSPVDCKGKKDGYYSNGCTSDFVSCFDGVASPMKCPASLVFNEKKGYCDYPESCSTGPAAAPPMSAPVVPAQPPYAPAQAPPSPMTPISCKGKKDGYYSNGCVSNFVYCVDGVATPMKCPSSLVFNEEKGYCDYPESCSTGPAPALPMPAPVVPPTQPPASAHAPPSPLTPVSCKGKKDGYYSNGCVSDFVYCVDGVASPMKCPASLVFNEKKGYCDYPESCSTVPTPAIPLPAPTAPVYAPPASQQASPLQPLPVDCKSKKDGYYSNGCVSDFVFCVDGVASPMKCPASLVFNEKKGYCDYPESCSTRPAPAPPLPAPVVPPTQPPASAHAPPSSLTPVSCKGKKDGYHSNGCVSDFVYCLDGVASPMKCPASLVFNEKKGYCDYPESCSAVPAHAVPSPVPSVPAQPSGPAYAPDSPSSPVSCKGRKDGYYSNGCVSEFVYCVDEVATPMTCPASLVFNEKKGYCDYPESCSSAPAPALPLPAPVVPPTQPPASAHAPPSSLTPVSCKGKKDGYYSNGCVSDFVFCVDGIASPMTCPASLVFNEKKGYCDYPESCATGPAPAIPWPAPVVPPTQPPASAHAPPSPLTPVSCKGKKDGYYSNGCVSDFVYCVDGVASPMSCPASLVFNEQKGYCDYPESCSTGPAAAPPLPAPVVTAQPPYAPAQAPPSPMTPISCKGKKDGYYSNGCVSDFVFCVDGVASAMKCPASLVFNEKKGYCDYPESCSTGPAPALPMPVPVVPSQPSASAQAPPAPLTSVDCKGKKDGYYSSGCVSEFVYCVDGVPTLMKCPSSLVFNAKNGYCDYPEACSSPPAQAAPAVPAPSTSTSGPSSQMSLDCTGRGDGYFAIGCSSDFVYCSDGIATFMKCPASLVFNAEKNYCDYPENCSGTGLDQADSQTGSAAPSPSVHSFVCPKPNGAFSNGCSTEYYVCSNAVAHVMLCPGSLVFNAAEGYCDLKDSCLQGEKAKDATTPVAYSPVTSTVPALSSSGTAVTPSASSKCSNLPDGRYGSPCGTKFMICSSGIAYFMNCPADLVFDSKQSRCVYADECGREPVLKSPSDVAPSSYTPLSSRDDCIGKTDGLHSLGCIAEFIQCVDGSAYSLYCPAGLVFVEEFGICDVPSACSAAPKHEPADGPMSYEPVVDDKSKDSPGCDIDGYFSQPCASEYFNCVGGIKFVGKCPAGLVFNMDKVYCDYPDNCSKGEDSASSEARPVPSTVINKDESCKGRPDGVITDTDCQHQFTTCSNEIAYVTKCPAGLVYSVKTKLCDYPEACGTASNDSVSSSTGSYPVQKTTVPPESAPHPTSASVQYQHSVVGKDLCAGKSDGPLNSTNCRPSFSFCVSGALYSTICPEGLLFSFASRRCEWRSECEDVVASPSEPSTTTTILPVHSAEFDCSTRPNGRYSLGGCVGRFVMCSDGRAYVRSCPSNLVYNEAKGLCDYDCSGPSAQPTAAPVETECITSVALGRCSSKFWRCRNGKLESAQCPGQSLFDETYSLCVYNLPECKTELGTTTSTSVEVPTTTATPVESTVYPTHGHYYPPPPPPPPPPAPQYPAQYPPYPPYGPSMGSSFGLFYPAAFPMGFRDVMYSREKVNNGPIDFQSRSAVVGGGFNPPVRDIFDGIVSPWLLPGIDRVFLPNVFKPPKQPDPYDGPFKPKGIDISGLLQQNEVNTPEPLGMFGMPLEDAVPPDDEEHHEDHGVTHEEKLESSSVANVTSPASEDTTPSMEAMDTMPVDDIEGSGEVEGTQKSGDVEVIRKRRSYSNNADFSTACTGPQSSGLVSIGFCRQDFIFCKSLGSGMMAACPVGDLFDSSTNKCVTSETCGIPVEVAEPPARKPIPPPMPVPLPILPQRRPPTPPSVPVTVPPVPLAPVFPPPHVVPTTTTTKRPPMIFPPMPAPVAAAQHLSPPSQDGCTEDYAVDCNGNFMKCSNGIAYPMKCPAGLVYDQTKQYCDYPEAVAGCGGAQVDHTPPGHSPIYPTDKTYPGDPILPSTTQAPTTKAPDFCSFMSDGLYSQGCTASFVICLDRRIQTSMNCPVGTWFDQTRGACDSREKVAACGGTSNEPSLHQPQPVVVRTTTPISYDDSCSPDPQAVGPCMPKFVVCSHGIHTEMECAQPLVFNPATVSCDYREFVKECMQVEGQDASSSSNGESAATIAPALLAALTTTTAAPTTTTTPSTTTTTPPIKCVYSEERPAFALDYCARVYGMCTVSGVLKREECDVGFLFDSHLSTCVPAEQCGQERLKDLLSKVTFAPPVAAAQVAQDSSKHTTRKDERCHNSPEGAMKPMGRCRSSYIRCMGGEAIVEPCATTAEVFSSAVGACVLRINAPECHSSPPRSPQPYSSVSSNDPSMFCRTRTDGLYRNPTDCTGILQCFGGDVFEYPSCSSGLVFNELTSKCDYRDAVPECRQAEDDKSVEHGCRGASHGDLVPDESDCQQFYRCVWNRLESMRCPSGTVFNPKLSVCDWPDNVPQCSAQQDESAVKVY